MIRTVILDFDQTVVDSRSVADLRAGKLWDALVPRIGEVTLCPGVADLLAYLQGEQIKVAIVSQSPRARYITPICAALGINVATILGYEDLTKWKPYPQGILYAVAKLWTDCSADPEAWRKAHDAHKGPMWAFYGSVGTARSDVLAIGDTAHDIEAARRAKIWSVGTQWAADEQDELVLAEPSYLCATPGDVIALIESLKAGAGWQHQKNRWSDAAHDRYAELCRSWVRIDGDYDWVAAEDQFYHLRTRHKGNWSTSLSNNYVEGFKKWPIAAGSEWMKRDAVARFARELAPFLPNGATYMCVPPSQARTDPGFNPRFDLLRDELHRIRPDLLFIEPVFTTATRPAAHAVKGKAHRRPELLMQSFGWTAAQWTSPERLYIIDDVMTLGTSFTAIQQFVRANAGGACEFIGAAWALHA